MTSTFLRGACLAAVLAASASYEAAASCAPDFPGKAPLPADAPLTLDAAISAVVSASPELRAAALETLAQRAEARQAGSPGNPEFEIDLEDFSGRGLRAFGASEATVSIAYPVALGGRLARARDAGEAWANATSAECGVQRGRLLLEASDLFHDLVAAEARAALAEDIAALSDEVARAVQTRIDSGGAARIELAPAEAERALTRAALQTARLEVDTLRLALAALWGEADARFGPADPGETQENLPTPDMVLARLDSHPAMASARAIRQARRADTALSRAETYPDVTVRLGMRSYRDTDERALMAGASVPLPLFNRNQGRRAAARLREEAAGLDAAALERRLSGQVRAAYAAAVSAETRARVLAEEAAPAARDGFSAAQVAYREGRYGLVQLLDARRRLIEVELQRVQAERDARKARDGLLALGGLPPFTHVTDGGRP